MMENGEKSKRRERHKQRHGSRNELGKLTNQPGYVSGGVVRMC